MSTHVRRRRLAYQDDRGFARLALVPGGQNQLVLAQAGGTGESSEVRDPSQPRKDTSALHQAAVALDNAWSFSTERGVAIQEGVIGGLITGIGGVVFGVEAAAGFIERNNPIRNVSFKVTFSPGVSRLGRQLSPFRLASRQSRNVNAAIDTTIRVIDQARLGRLPKVRFRTPVTFRAGATRAAQ